MKKKSSLGAVCLALSPISVLAAPIYTGSGSLSGTYDESIIINSPGSISGQIEVARCRTTLTRTWSDIIANAGVPSVTTTLLTSVSSVTLSGDSSYCRSGENVQLFPFRIVNASADGISGSNSARTLFFNWLYSADRSTLSGEVSEEIGPGTVLRGSANLRLASAVPEPATAALLLGGLLGVVGIRSGRGERR